MLHLSQQKQKLMKLNKFRTFALITFITVIIYYFQHIHSAEFVFEDSQWIGFTGSWNPKSLMMNIPNNFLAIWSFYIFPHEAPVEHSVNLLIHIVNALILASLINQWDGPGWIVGSLFLINPLSIQAVAYAAGRSELLGLTELLGLLWFATVNDLSVFYRWIGFLLYAIAMLFTKATLIVFTPFLLIWIYLSDYDLYWLKKLDLELFAIYLISILFMAPRVIAHISSDIPLWHWFLAQTSASWMLLYSALIGRNLSIDHAWWMIDFRLQLISAVALIIAIIMILISRYPFISFGLGWWFITISPRLLIPSKLGWIREHHAYVPLVGICIALASLIQELSCLHVAEGNLESQSRDLECSGSSSFLLEMEND